MSPTLTIDIDRCVACGRCEIACVVEHCPVSDLAAAIGRPDAPPSRIRLTQMDGMPAVLVCVHCEDPACAAVCPAGAITRGPSGEVLLAEEQCVGCGACAVACHLGVPTLRADGAAYVSCDLCRDRRDAGRPTACSEACPTGAIVFGTAAAGEGLVEYIRPQGRVTVYARVVGHK